MKKAVVLLSGGLDSTIALYLAKSEGYQVYALSFDYGQKHNRELECAKASSEKVGVAEHKIVSLNLNLGSSSSLTNPDVQVEDGDANRTDIPQTYVPARNMVFLSVAASYAESVQAQHIFIGVSQVDYSGYVDCRESFIKAMENAINQGTVMAVEEHKLISIHAPFLFKSKTEEIKLGAELNVDFSHTWSCYRGGETPCGTCDSCLLRARAFAEAGVIDTALNEEGKA
ncbi:7-cyano-7-deazaguanine synthase QueC [Saccharicrinis sp. FJH2]|uniref:7-cyano-7-deazaguanine synthase QueC n=1 Tax=Saccharicrinis sp. FJH65 TaxID=3344659 RepID=UPI0035F4C8A1